MPYLRRRGCAIYIELSTVCTHVLSFVGEELSPMKTIADYGIEDEAVLHLVEGTTGLSEIKALLGVK